MLALFAAVVIIVIPALRLAVAPDNPLYLSDYYVLLLGKIMCYAIVALAMDLIWGYAGILSLGHGLFFALGGYSMGMYLMREIGNEGQYRSFLPDYMVFLDWKEFPWYWAGTEYFWLARTACVCFRLVRLSFAHPWSLFFDHYPSAHVRLHAAILP
jgi:urea transport system permease protein